MRHTSRTPRTCTASTAWMRWSWAAPSTAVAGWTRPASSPAACPTSWGSGPSGCSPAVQSATLPGRGMDRVDASEVERHTGALDHRVFGGRLDDTLLSRGERARARRARVAPGDYREWAEIRWWAEELAYQLDQQELAARITLTEESQP